MIMVKKSKDNDDEEESVNDNDDGDDDEDEEEKIFKNTNPLSNTIFQCHPDFYYYGQIRTLSFLS